VFDTFWFVTRAGLMSYSGGRTAAPSDPQPYIIPDRYTYKPLSFSDIYSYTITGLYGDGIAHNLSLYWAGYAYPNSYGPTDWYSYRIP